MPLYEQTPLLAAPQVDVVAAAQRAILKKGTTLPAAEVAAVLFLYRDVCAAAGLDVLAAVSQMCEETGWLTSFWSQPPRRNPAGIGVTGEAGAGVSFPSWADAVQAHVGRLLLYALPTTATPTDYQAKLIAIAQSWRTFPSTNRGVAPTLSGLTGRWATDPNYSTVIEQYASVIEAS